MLSKVVLFHILFLLFSSLYGSTISQLVITAENGRNVTGMSYYAASNVQFQLTCSGGSNVSWYHISLNNDVMIKYSGPNRQYASPSGQVLSLFRLSDDPSVTFVCKSSIDAGLRVTVLVKHDLIDSATAVSTSSIRITWTAPTQTISLIIVYRILGTSNYEIAGTVGSNVGQFSITTLLAYTQYEVKISSYSSAKAVQTLQDVPSGPPLNVMHTIWQGSEMMKMSWQLPSAGNRNGIISSYTLMCSSNGISTARLTFSSGNDANFTYPTEFSGAVPVSVNTTYSCQVAASTSVGMGPYSPLQVVSTQPVTLAITPDSSTKQVLLMWNVPDVVPGVDLIDSISYQYGRYQEYASTDYNDPTATNSNHRSVIIPNLLDGKPYQALVSIQISYVNVVATVIFFYKEIVPSASVDGLNTLTLNQTAVQISWKTVTLEEAGGMPHYRITLTSSSAPTRSVSTEGSLLVVSGLVPDRQYSASVVVVNSAGSGPSAMGSFSTTGVPTSGSLSDTGVIVGISLGSTIGVVILMALVAAVVVVCFLRHKSKTSYTYNARQRYDSNVLYEQLKKDVNVDGAGQGPAPQFPLQEEPSVLIVQSGELWALSALQAGHVAGMSGGLISSCTT